MANTTPRSLGSNMLNNLVESHVGSSRDAIKADLLEKIVYNDPVEVATFGNCFGRAAV